MGGSRFSCLQLLTSSLMPVSRSIMTQASMGRATSLPLLFRCSSSPVPNAGFSVHESEKEEANWGGGWVGGGVGWDTKQNDRMNLWLIKRVI